MKRRVGIWHTESNNNQAIGELIIDGNHIEFYSRFLKEFFSKQVIISDDKTPADNYSYKIFVDGYTTTNNKFIDFTFSHRVTHAICGKIDSFNDYDLSGITEFSFTFPELENWLGIETVSYCMTEDKKIAVVEKSVPSILLKESNPKIEICFKSKTFERNIEGKGKTEKIVCQEPKIFVSYDNPNNIQTVNSEIECLMQFFSLLIGRVSDVKDIFINRKSFLYINRDFSYNLTNGDRLNSFRADFDLIENKLKDYYLNWRSFFKTEKFSLVRRVFFYVNNKKEKFAEDIFTEYVRILDSFYIKKYSYEKFKGIREDDFKKGYLRWKLKGLDKEYIYNIISKNAPNNDTDKFIERIVKTRNLFSHYGKYKKEDVFSYYELNETIRVLKAAIICCLLSKIIKGDESRVKNILAKDSELFSKTAFLT